MSGVEIVGLITTAIEGIGYCIQVYDAIRDTAELPKAFQVVREDLPLAHNTLTLALEQATASNANPQDVDIVRETVAGTRQKTRELEKILRKIRDSRLESKDSSILLGYRSLVLKLGGKDHAVEVLMREVLVSVKSLSANHVFRLATAEQLQGLEQAINRLSSIEPSYKEDQPARAGDTFNAGRDLQALTGSGKFYNVSGSKIGNMGDGGKVKNIEKRARPGAYGEDSDEDSDSD